MLERLLGVRLLARGAEHDPVSPFRRMVKRLGRGKKRAPRIGRGKTGLVKPVPAIPYPLGPAVDRNRVVPAFGVPHQFQGAREERVLTQIANHVARALGRQDACPGIALDVFQAHTHHVRQDPGGSGGHHLLVHILLANGNDLDLDGGICRAELLGKRALRGHPVALDLGGPERDHGPVRRPGPVAVSAATARDRRDQPDHQRRKPPSP